MPHSKCKYCSPKISNCAPVYTRSLYITCQQLPFNYVALYERNHGTGVYHEQKLLSPCLYCQQGFCHNPSTANCAMRPSTLGFTSGKTMGWYSSSISLLIPILPSRTSRTGMSHQPAIITLNSLWSRRVRVVTVLGLRCLTTSYRR